MSIFEHIQYLITRHDCVVVAGLGAFVAQRVPAKFSSDGRMLLPPGRSLVFNNAITHDDGLLTGSIARRNGLSFEAAREEVGRQVEMMRSRMQAEGSIELPRIGRLTLVDGALIEFTPDTARPIADLIYSSLPIVTLSETETSADAEAPVILEVDTIGRRIASRLLKAGKYAAIVAMIFAAGATLTTPVILDRPTDRASLSLPAVTPARKATLPATLTVGMHPAANYGPEVTAKASVETNPISDPVVSLSDYSGENPENDFRHFIIVGSCTSASEARRFIARKGSDKTLRVINSDGRYRIYAAMSNDADAAETYRSTNPTIRAEFPDAWVYSR